MTEERQSTFWVDAPPFRPLLKWPGGKAREWSEIEPFLPARIRRLADPFMGGLAPFARTPFRERALLNDRHARLVDLHVRVQQGDAEFLAALTRHSDVWDRLAGVAESVQSTFREAVEAARVGGEPDAALFEPVVRRPLEEIGLGTMTLDFVTASLADKARRIARLEVKHTVHFDPDQLERHGETALRAGYYTRVRHRERTAEGAQGTADFHFVRETCYGSMFRTNAKGEFNIPYGGASYNGKSFRSRVAQISDPATRRALERATFHCGDFEAFLDAVAADLGPDDFVFVDPPYHSDFSTYGPNAFSLDDQRRLAAALRRLRTPWLLVIKETPEVREIHAAPGAEVVHEFGKTYGYNVRGRNDRSARHLVIRG